MKKFGFLTAAIIAASPLLSARDIKPVRIDSLSFDRHGDFMVVDMNLDLEPVSIKSSRAQIITPMIVSQQGDTVTLPSVGVYGRQRYINYLRNDRAGLSRESETAFRESERPSDFDYQASVPFKDWMDFSNLVIRRRLFGCANCLLEEEFDNVGSYVVLIDPVPDRKNIIAEAVQAKTDTLKGAAYIDFIVDKTFIAPDYRRNPVELMKIQSSIDTVLNDKDVTITGVWLKGFASPESPYAHNTDLAIGRTEAIKDYIQQLYNFKPGIISTDYEPEDWEGLRQFVVNSNIDHKEEILALMDSDMKPVPKEAPINKRLPKEYKFMLDTFYPALRHTEYRITYEIKRFDDVDKIREVMRTKPNRLSLREFYILANATLPGSDEYNEVYETAARMYPDDPVAAINAANVAMERKDYESAEKYLRRAGDSDDAQYARAALAYSIGEYDKAEEILKTLPDMPQAQSLLESVDNMRSRMKSKYIKIDLE